MASFTTRLTRLLYAGPSAGLVRDVLPAAEIVRLIVGEAEEAWQRLLASRRP